MLALLAAFVGSVVGLASLSTSTSLTYDALGQLKSVTGREPGGSVSRLHEQIAYTYDPAGNLAARVNNGQATTLTYNGLNQPTGSTRPATLTLAGFTTGAATEVKVDNGTTTNTASRYADHTFAGTVPLLANAYYTATATDAQGRKDTNTVLGQFPASTSYTYDANGNLTAADGNTYEYDDENRLVRVTRHLQWKAEFSYDARGRLSGRAEYDFWQIVQGQIYWKLLKSVV